jgi:uncharacterized protein
MAAEKRIKDYGIAFKGLRDGEHVFKFKLDNSFFELFEAAQVEAGDLTATVRLSKSSRMLEFEFSISGVVETICDRCLSEVDTPIEFNGTLYVKFGEFYDEPTEEIVILPHESHTFNVAQFMYEFIVVSIPIRHVHPDNENGTPGCDINMLKRLDDYMVDEAPVDDPDEETNYESIDPRWDELKKLINKNNK